MATPGALTVYVPRVSGTLAKEIDLASGIVGSPSDEPGIIRIDFEGNRHGAVNIVTWADRLRAAASRHQAGYPTIAQLWVPETELVAIGRFDAEEGEVRLSAAPGVYGHWLPDLAPTELRCSGRPRRPA